MKKNITLIDNQGGKLAKLIIKNLFDSFDLDILFSLFTYLIYFKWIYIKNLGNSTGKNFIFLILIFFNNFNR